MGSTQGFTKEFNRLVTEERNERTMDLDNLNTIELVARVQQEDFEVAKAVQVCLPEIAKAIDIITARLKDGGRLLYFGAGHKRQIRRARRDRMPTDLWRRNIDCSSFYCWWKRSDVPLV